MSRHYNSLLAHLRVLGARPEAGVYKSAGRSRKTQPYVASAQPASVLDVASAQPASVLV